MNYFNPRIYSNEFWCSDLRSALSHCNSTYFRYDQTYGGNFFTTNPFFFFGNPTYYSHSNSLPHTGDLDNYDISIRRGLINIYNYMDVIYNYTRNCQFSKIKSVILPQEQTELCCYYFTNFSNLQKVTIPSNVEYIGRDAFSFQNDTITCNLQEIIFEDPTGWYDSNGNPVDFSNSSNNVNLLKNANFFCKDLSYVEFAANVPEHVDY